MPWWLWLLLGWVAGSVVCSVAYVLTIGATNDAHTDAYLRALEADPNTRAMTIGEIVNRRKARQ